LVIIFSPILASLACKSLARCYTDGVCWKWYIVAFTEHSLFVMEMALQPTEIRFDKIIRTSGMEIIKKARLKEYSQTT